MADAVAFDTGFLLKQLLLKPTVSDRSALRSALIAESSEGLTGKFKFKEDGHIDRELFVLTLKGNKVAEWKLEDDITQAAATEKK